MQDDVYFLPLIVSAWPDPARPASLMAAFETVLSRGQELRYRVGLMQFEQWMRFVAAHRALLNRGDRGALLHRLRGPLEITVQLYRDGLTRACGTLRHGTSLVVNDVQRGMNRLVLETGWVVWEATLAPADLLWAAAPRGKALPVAAAASATRQPPDAVISAPAGIEIRVFRGGQSGRIELALRPEM